MARAVRVALIGFGYWGPNYARVFQELPDSQITAICEISPERRQRAQDRYPQTPCTSDVEEVLRRGDVDCLVISTQASTHFELARRGLESGRHVLVEKPLALAVEDCERLCSLAERTGRVLMVAHTFLYNAGIRKMKQYMQSPEFGRVYYLHATRTNLGPIRRDVNAVWDLAPHDISIFNYLLDQKPLWASAIGSPVLGSNRDIISPKIEASEPLKNQCVEFIASISDGARPLSDSRFGTWVVRTLLAIEASMRAHGAAKEV